VTPARRVDLVGAQRVASALEGSSHLGASEGISASRSSQALRRPQEWFPAPQPRDHRPIGIAGVLDGLLQTGGAVLARGVIAEARAFRQHGETASLLGTAPETPVKGGPHASGTWVSQDDRWAVEG